MGKMPISDADFSDLPRANRCGIGMNTDVKLQIGWEGAFHETDTGSLLIPQDIERPKH